MPMQLKHILISREARLKHVAFVQWRNIVKFRDIHYYSSIFMICIDSYVYHH